MVKKCHKNTGTLSDADTKVVLEVSVETKDVCLYILGRECTKSAYPAGQTKSLRKYFDLKMFGNNTSQWNCMHEDNKSSLILGRICYHLVENLMFSHLLSTDVEMTVPLLYICLAFTDIKFRVLGLRKNMGWSQSPFVRLQPLDCWNRGL
jgi:hypothetical protein